MLSKMRGHLSYLVWADSCGATKVRLERVPTAKWHFAAPATGTEPLSTFHCRTAAISTAVRLLEARSKGG
jgi:hypothetical protein